MFEAQVSFLEEQLVSAWLPYLLALSTSPFLHLRMLEGFQLTLVI